MLPILDVPKSPHSFETADGLVTYMERRLQKPRSLGAFVSMEQLAQLAYLAGRDIHLSNKDIENLNKRRGLVSLFDHNYETLVPVARKRIGRGEIPDNWLEGFNKFVASMT